MSIDEMLLDLRTILEAFDAEPSHMAFAHLQHEMMRIERFCEDMLPDLYSQPCVDDLAEASRKLRRNHEGLQSNNP